jgi:alkylation response protein AidB-like acyl-CoA dehydrogenase
MSGTQKWQALAETVARQVLSRHAEDVDQRGRWPEESIGALADAGLLGLTVPPSYGGAGEGPSAFAAVLRTLAEHCASSAMIYLMHVCATQVIAAGNSFSRRESVLRDIAAGRHLSTLAFSEKGSRSHFWAPISQAAQASSGFRLSAEKSFVTSAGRADSYLVSTRTAARDEPMVLSIYFVPQGAPGVSVSSAWNGLGLRGNASAPMRLAEVGVAGEQRVCEEGAGFQTMIEVVLPWFQLGSGAVSVGIARAATEGIRQHLVATKLEHLHQSLAALPTLRARLAQMQIAVDTQQVFLEYLARQMESPGPATMLAVLESKAAAAEMALQVTDLAMRTGGGACFGRGLAVERNFRDARAGAVMAPTTDVLYDFLGKSLLGLPLF